MAWWGTLLGGTLGFMFGGALGALLGAALGSNFDKGLKLTDSFAPGDQERVQAAFFTACFSIMGHIAKADGRVSQQEIEAARHIMSQMQLNEEQREAAIRLFNEGKQAGFPFDEVLAEFKRECQRRHNLLQMFIEIQLATAMADGELHANERRLIKHMADSLGFSAHEIEHLIKLATGATHQHQRQGMSLDEAYAMLDIDKTASDADVKKAYRRLMSQHHPDKLVAKGLPEEMIQDATAKTQQIRKAYEQVQASRK